MESAAVSAVARAGSIVRADADRRERALVRDAQRGSADAFEQLFRRHWPRAYRAALLVVGDAAAAEDIAQGSVLPPARALASSGGHADVRPCRHALVVQVWFARWRSRDP